MYELLINGKKQICASNKTLLSFLRDDLRLIGAKNACGQGACGACVVIVDGRASRSCLGTVDKFVGKDIITIEGLSSKEKEIFSYTFAQTGAVQCGFCSPGFVIAGKALLDQNLNPTDEEIKKAISANICRCTGYVKIIDAINLAASIMRGEQTIKHEQYSGKVGTHIPRIDAKGKTLGTAEYVDDMFIEGMLYGGVVRSKYPRAKIVSIDTTKAEALDGVEAVMTAKDVPGNRYIGHLAFISDWPALIAEGEITRYLGDALAIIAAKDKTVLEQAKLLVEVVYEELKPVDTIQEALKANIIVHESNPKNMKTNILAERTLNRGNVEEAIQNSKYVVTKSYITPATEHAFMEPESALAHMQSDGTMILYTGGQGIYDELREVSEVLGFSQDKVRVISKYVGGGFGGKEDMSVQHHAALLSWKTCKPVKLTISRTESMLLHPKRHRMEIEVTSACDEEGKLTAVKAIILSDTGAYASVGGPVLERACTHAVGPYNCPNIDVKGYAVYTNNMPAGAFRGFGVCQSNFATESNLNLLAEKVGISPWEIRYRNAVEAGQKISNGQIADASTGLKETLEIVKKEFEQHKFAGIACAFKNAGIGMGKPDAGRCRIIVEEHGKVRVCSSAACIGQGVATVMMQVVCETLGLTPEQIIINDPDTSVTPNSGTTTASRQTVFTGEATRQAALQLKEALKTNLLTELAGKEFSAEFFPESDPIDSPKPDPKYHESYGFATQVVILDEQSGLIKKIVAAHDVGRVINPKALEGQIEGGVVMSMGYALTEDYPHINSVPAIQKYAQLGLLKANQIPEIESVFVEKGDKNSIAYGAKGVGEISSIPTASAIQYAYYRYNNTLETELPLKNTPYSRKK